MKFFRTLLLSAAALGSAALAQFDFGFGGMPQQKLVTASAQASVSRYDGQAPFYIIFSADVEEPWHAYYRNPATVGMPLEATLTAPEGFKIEGPFWKVPTRLEGIAGVSYGYSKPVLTWRVTPEANAPETATFSISSNVQVCSDTGCMPPESDTQSVQLTKGNHTPADGWNESAALSGIEVLGDTFHFDKLTIGAVTQTADTITINFTSKEPAEMVCFFSDDNSISPVAEQKLEAVEGGYRLTLQRNDNSDSMYPVADESLIGKPLPALKGILRVGRAHQRIDVDLTQPVATPSTPEKDAAPADKAPAAENESMTLPVLFGSLFLGGLILNLMPCVFPVIGLKVMSFVELGGGTRRKVFMHSLAFVLGILLSFWVLALLLIIFSNLETLATTPWQDWVNVLLADSGTAPRSWAEWMQNEWMVYIILLLLLAMGLSMYGVFEIGVGATGVGQDLQNRKGYMGSFFSGLFVTVVATPCSGPFIGEAMLTTMALPGLMMIAALTFMALGLASPYIVLGAFPSLVKLLPRPGAWMESLKQGLSFLLFAAAAWFLDIYMAFVEEEHLVKVLISLVGICTAFWVYGRWCPLYRSRASRIAGFLIALALLGVSVWGSMPRTLHATPEETQEAAASTDTEYMVARGSNPVWNEWSPALMEQALEDGHPVYVDFTAKWCATCQANKNVAYSAEVLALMENAEVVLMRADKTRPNPTIDAEMRRLNRSAVPVNVLYLPGGESFITRELLTAPYLMDWLNEHLSVL